MADSNRKPGMGSWEREDMMSIEEIIMELHSRAVYNGAFEHAVIDQLKLCERRIAELEIKLELQTRLAIITERAMDSCAEASRGFERLANKYFDYKEPLERVVDSARLFVATQDTLAPGDFAGDKFDDLKQELSKVRDWTKL